MSKLTPIVTANLCKYIAAGNYIETACKMARISKPTYYVWRKKAEEGKSPYKQLFEEIERATAEAEARNVVKIQQAANDNWQAAAWYLERKHAERWGRKDQLLMKMLKMSDEEIDAILSGSKDSEAD